eukprot:COSAG01_NODE_6756_length_3513_cov_7.084359_4_plen_81_part_01
MRLCTHPSLDHGGCAVDLLLEVASPPCLHLASHAPLDHATRGLVCPGLSLLAGGTPSNQALYEGSSFHGLAVRLLALLLTP